MYLSFPVLTPTSQLKSTSLLLRLSLSLSLSFSFLAMSSSRQHLVVPSSAAGSVDHTPVADAPKKVKRHASDTSPTYPFPTPSVGVDTSLPPLEAASDNNASDPPSPSPAPDTQLPLTPEEIEDAQQDSTPDVDGDAHARAEIDALAGVDQKEFDTQLTFVSPKDTQLQTATASDSDMVDISRELAHKLGCYNVYWSDQDLSKERLVAKYQIVSQGCKYYSISVKGQADQWFLGSKLPPGKYILLPLAPLASAYMPPHGTLDKTKMEEGKVTLAVSKGMEHQAKVEVGIKPSFFNVFTQSPDGRHDMPLLGVFNWLQRSLGPAVSKALEMIGVNVEEF